MKGVFCVKESTKAYLVDIYNSIPKKTKATCLKFYYQYHNVNVNVYFDAFDNQSVVLSIVLSAKKKYYYTPLNILNTGMITEYLSEIPPQILEKILVDNHLDDFYENMEKHLLEDKPHFNYYNEDTYFVNTIKYAKSKLDLPFWWYLRKVPMSDDTLNALSERADISRETLLEIQKQGFTLVRTDDIEKRRSLTLILGEHGITL